MSCQPIPFPLPEGKIRVSWSCKTVRTEHKAKLCIVSRVLNMILTREPEKTALSIDCSAEFWDRLVQVCMDQIEKLPTIDGEPEPKTRSLEALYADLKIVVQYGLDRVLPRLSAELRAAELSTEDEFLDYLSTIGEYGLIELAHGRLIAHAGMLSSNSVRKLPISLMAAAYDRLPHQRLVRWTKWWLKGNPVQALELYRSFSKGQLPLSPKLCYAFGPYVDDPQVRAALRAALDAEVEEPVATCSSSLSGYCSYSSCQRYH